MKKIVCAVFICVAWILSGNAPEAWALIPVVPFTPSEYLNVTTGPAGCGLSCQSSTTATGNGGQNLSVASPQPSASGAISLPAAGLPDLSVSVQNPPNGNATAQVNYINTIRFVYTGSGTPPAVLSSSIAWTVDATVQVPKGTPFYEIGGGSSIGVSLSTCYCPEQFVYTDIAQSGIYTLANPFKIADGGSIAYDLSLDAWAYGDTGLTGSVSLDPEVEIGLPAGWTGFLGSGGTLGSPPIQAAPEPPTFLLLAPFLALWMLALKAIRSRKIHLKGP